MNTYIATFAGDRFPLLIRARDWIDAFEQANRLKIVPLQGLRAATFQDDHLNMDNMELYTT